MKLRFRLSAAIAAISLVSVATPTLFAKSDLENICISVGRLLEEGHYTHRQLNDEMSRRILRTYLEILDFSHLFFTQEDIDAIYEKYGTSLDDDILLGNLKPAYEIYDVYQKRVDDRVAKIKELLKQPPDFKSNGTIDLSRQKAPWPKNESLVPGGPAEVDGRLKVGDRITAVGQASGDLVDVRDMRLDKVVEMIRGKKGTKVKLLVIPADSADPSQRKNVELVRDEIKLKDQEARADIIIKKDEDGKTVKLGWITLPSFYADMDHHAKSTTKDVAMLLRRLKKENIAGLVVDLRRNGGGSLEEVISLTHLFIKPGPVVQTKGSNGYTTVSSEPNPGLAYSGPVVVVTSRQSASASEIFAAALQDYGRAVIVGDQSTFGKGTVQTILEIGRFTSLLGNRSQEDGALKLTIQKFYRVAGGSTQLHGVGSDIVLPSLTDLPEFGEGALKNCLPYDEVPKAKYTKWNEPVSLYLEELKRRSAARAQEDPEFHYVMEDMERLRHRLDDNRISLNEDVRKKELADDKMRKELRAKERLARNTEEPRVYRVTLDTVDKPNLQLIMYPGKLASAKKNGSAKVAPEAAADADTENDILGNLDDGTKEPVIDPERDETTNILADLIRLERGPKTASTNR